MECTSIKFELFWRKISRKDGCKGVSENAHTEHPQKQLMPGFLPAHTAYPAWAYGIWTNEVL